MYYQVRDVMTPDPITVNPGDTLAEVEQIFEEHDFNGIPVVDRKKRLLGFITKHDLLKVSCPVNYKRPILYPAMMRESVLNVMTKSPTAVWPDTTLTTVLGVIVEKEYKSLPVVENHTVVGIIARQDILVALQKASMGVIPVRLISPGKKGLLEPDGLPNNGARS
jgi:CBS domain-containing protein